MSGKKAKAARKAAPAQQQPRSLWRSWTGALVGAVVVAVIAASFVVPTLLNRESGSTTAPAHDGMSIASSDGTGLRAGSPVPEFAETNVETGQPITSTSLYRHKTLLFFSEGVMCQACFEQIKGLEQMGSQLATRGIQLISITPDSPAELRQAIDQYGIRSPMVSDDDGDMSRAFNTLGKGMHGDTPGHAFALIDRGTVRWYHDYWLPPHRTMYVDPQKVITDLPRA